MATPELVPLFTLTAATVTTGRIIGGPLGTRVIVDASSGSFDGERLRGTVHGPGGDWVTVRTDGTIGLDVRLLLRTDDGADIYMEYRGIARDNATHITTAPMFQTGAEAYAWLNQVVAIARGSSDGRQVVYEVFEVR
ncbi:MAG: DUF3237 domain-containing protein [Ilumatobacteraceae bacterium]|nr:DUF3237 domain-containing protein [Acidimicrobiales bacterium]MCB9395776.1 DUF3237 domain-containing protein [Acidimicrobiaceae bacterium]